MIFSSITFLLIFLPVILLVYYIPLKGRRKLQNIHLTMSSLFFYAWGEPVFVLVMLLSILINYLLARLIDKYREDKEKAKIIFISIFVFNLGILFIFKYLMFFLDNMNLLFNTQILLPIINLPIGISFFTFQAMSYVFDVYRKNGEVQKKIGNVALYIAFFPQLIAGPIVRYKTISKQINERKESYTLFSSGVHRFLIGLFKKVLIANNVAFIADYVFKGDVISSGSITLWIGAIMYTLQIYFDFSGYSDMAIGLGRMFGFEFLENFNYPYISKSVSEFWTRWHISLGNWFKDYIYFPLGGSRVNSKMKLIFNLSIVWLFTGIWHGANWTFISWGLFYLVLIAAEKLIPSYKKLLDKSIIGNILTLLFVIIGWVLFRSESISEALIYLKGMFVFKSGADLYLSALLRENMIFILIGLLAVTPLYKVVEEKLDSNAFIVKFTHSTIYIAVFIVTLSYMVKSSYNPFIYFNF